MIGYSVIRRAPEGYRAFKVFDTREDAEEFLKSDSVKDDESFGYKFWIEEYERRDIK